MGSAYGAAGTLLILMLWVYYSAQLLFLGAEFTQVYTNRRRAPASPSAHARPVTIESRVQQGLPPREARPVHCAGRDVRVPPLVAGATRAPAVRLDEVRFDHRQAPVGAPHSTWPFLR